MERRRFRSLPPRLELLEVLRRRLRGGVRLRLLLRVSRRSRALRMPIASSSVSGVGVAPTLSRLRDDLLRGVRLSDLDGDRDTELLLRRDRRVLGGGDGLGDSDMGLRFDGLGEREREDTERVGDRRRDVRIGLLPLATPPRPRYVLPLLPGDLDPWRGEGERDLEGERCRRRGGVRDPESDRIAEGDRDFDIDSLGRLFRRGPPRPPGT